MVILEKNHWGITKNLVFSSMSHKKKQKAAGMLVTGVRSGDAPKPQFSMKTNKQIEKAGNQGQVNHRNWFLFLSLHGGYPCPVDAVFSAAMKRSTTSSACAEAQISLGLVDPSG